MYFFGSGSCCWGVGAEIESDENDAIGTWTEDVIPNLGAELALDDFDVRVEDGKATAAEEAVEILFKWKTKRKLTLKILLLYFLFLIIIPFPFPLSLALSIGVYSDLLSFSLLFGTICCLSEVALIKFDEEALVDFPGRTYFLGEFNFGALLASVDFTFVNEDGMLVLLLLLKLLLVIGCSASGWRFEEEAEFVKSEAEGVEEEADDEDAEWCEWRISFSRSWIRCSSS